MSQERLRMFYTMKDRLKEQKKIFFSQKILDVETFKNIRRMEASIEKRIKDARNG